MIGPLVDSLRANPRTIVLFDEIEKAHPDILRALMNAMDAGRLSTASAHTSGRQVDCRRAVCQTNGARCFKPCNLSEAACRETGFG